MVETLMKVISARNVNDALLLGLDLFQFKGNYRVQESRNGTTYEALEPVTTVYKTPLERVSYIGTLFFYVKLLTCDIYTTGVTYLSL